MDSKSKHLCMRCYISGKVQGVWFRASTKEQAEKLKISGWVRNLDDGRVEVFACGTETQLQLLDSWLRQGPALAQVTEYISEHLPWEAYKGFEVI